MRSHVLCTGIPSKPTNVSVKKTTHNMTASNITLSWNQPTMGRVDHYKVNVTSYETQSVDISLMTNTSSAEVEGIPYDQNITIVITSVNCYSENEGDTFTINISEEIFLSVCHLLANHFTCIVKSTSRQMCKASSSKWAFSQQF